MVTQGPVYGSRYGWLLMPWVRACRGLGAWLHAAGDCLSGWGECLCGHADGAVYWRCETCDREFNFSREIGSSIGTGDEQNVVAYCPQCERERWKICYQSYRVIYRGKGKCS